MPHHVFPEENGLLTCLTTEQHAKYFPLRKFVERHKVKRMARDPGTGEMGLREFWDPIGPVETIEPNAREAMFPDTELTSLRELEWIQIHMDPWTLGTLASLMLAPEKWPQEQGHFHLDIIRYASHPLMARGTLYPLSLRIAGILARTETFDFARAMDSKPPLHTRYFDHIVDNIELKQAISRQSRQSLDDETNKLVLWYRDPCDKGK